MTRRLLVALLLLPRLVGSADFPSLRGPLGTGEMPAWNGALVDDPKQAKLLWTSEERNVGVGWGYGVGPSNKNRSTVRSCGFSGPVAAGDRVYFMYYVPSGDVVDDQTREKGQDKRPESWKVDADDVLLCADAATGKTLWKAVFAGKGLNWNLHRKTPWTYPCVVGDRVFFLGSAGKVYCVNAHDGKTVWQSDTGEGFREFEKMRAAMRAAQTTETWKKSRIEDTDSGSPNNSTPCFVAGVLVVNDSLRERSTRDSPAGNGLVGLDAATGALLWRIPDAIGSYSSPVPWQDNVISVAPRRALCVEPKAGQVVWEITERMDGRSTPAVSAEYLLAQRSVERGAVKDLGADEKGLTCYRLTPTGATKLWEMEAGPFSGPFSAPVIHGQYGYALCKAGLVCVELATGTIIGQIEKVGDGYLPLMAGNGRLFAGLDMVNMDPKDFRLLGTLPVSHETFTPVHYSEGRVYVRGRLPGYGGKNKDNVQPPEPGCLYCVDLRK